MIRIIRSASYQIQRFSRFATGEAVVLHTLLILLFLSIWKPSRAQEPVQNGLPPILQNVDFRPELDSRVPLQLTFQDETGRSRKLDDFFQGKPVILALVYYDCPMLCDRILESIARSLRVVSLVPGTDYQVVAASFNPNDTPAMAAQKKRSLLQYYPRPHASAGWHFLTGREDAIGSLTKSVKFSYSYDPKTKMYAHASGILVLTPQGRISRYLSGIDYPARDLQFALIDAANGKIGTVVDHLLLFCFQYNPTTGKYGAAVLRLVRWGGALSIIGLTTLILMFQRRDKRMRRVESSAHVGEL